MSQYTWGSEVSLHEKKKTFISGPLTPPVFKWLSLFHVPQVKYICTQFMACYSRLWETLDYHFAIAPFTAVNLRAFVQPPFFSVRCFQQEIQTSAPVFFRRCVCVWVVCVSVDCMWVGWMGCIFVSSLISRERLGAMIRFQHFLPGRRASPACIPPRRQATLWPGQAPLRLAVRSPDCFQEPRGDRGRVSRCAGGVNRAARPHTLAGSWLAGPGAGRALLLGPLFPQEAGLEADNVQEPVYLACCGAEPPTSLASLWR